MFGKQVFALPCTEIFGIHRVVSGNNFLPGTSPLLKFFRQLRERQKVFSVCPTSQRTKQLTKVAPSGVAYFPSSQWLPLMLNL